MPEEPPDLRDVELNFDDFHDLAHSIFDRNCGNRRLHWTYGWQYKWSEAIWAKTLCRIGRHDATDCWNMEEGKPVSLFKVCHNCGKHLSEPQPW